MIRRLADRSSPVRLAVLTVALLGCFLVWHAPSLTREETLLYAKIRTAQTLLWSEMERRGQADSVNDPDRTGFIGLDWSETSTTLGKLDAKQNACDPLWGVVALRWFDALGLEKGDRIAVLSTSSFPGTLHAVLAAAESRELSVNLVVSLGSSAWGANRPEAPWPVMARILASHGFLRTRPVMYTLGGNGETGQGMLEEGVAALTGAAAADGTALYKPADGLAAVIQKKMEMVAPEDGKAARLVVNIGGSHSSLGTDEVVLELKSGLLIPDKNPGALRFAGNGTIGSALKKGIPVAHFLNFRSLAVQEGVAFTERRPYIMRGAGWPAFLGIALFVLALATHRRWSWEE